MAGAVRGRNPARPIARMEAFRFRMLTSRARGPVTTTHRNSETGSADGVEPSRPRVASNSDVRPAIPALTSLTSTSTARSPPERLGVGQGSAMRISRLPTRIVLACGASATVSAVALVLVLTGVFSAQARTIAKPSSASSHAGFTVKLANVDFGSDGAKGHFSAKLSAGARDIAAVLAAVTGVPYPEIAKGGTYVAKVTNGGGRAVIKFSNHALGTACAKYSAKAGKYNPRLVT
jgi:hypothetical protein